MLIDFLLRQRCLITPWLGYEDGRDVYGEAEERACRVQEGSKLTDAGGVSGEADARAAAALMFCRGEAVPERSRVACEGREYIVTACRRARGFGEEHLEVTLR